MDFLCYLCKRLAKYVPAKGWVAARLSVNLQSVFQGVSEFIPPSNFQARMAVQELDNIKILEGADKPLNVKFAEEHGKKKAQIYAVASIRKAKNWGNRRTGGVFSRLGYTQKRGIKSRLGHRQMKRLI